MITVFADQHLYKIKEIVPGDIDLRLYNPENGLPGDIDRADALLIRTVTPINKKTLNPVPKKLKFIGTGSAGTDHVDREYLRGHDIKFAYSAGCNAGSVAEYVVTALLIWAERRQINLDSEMIGIVGVGHVGSAVQKMLDRLGWKHVLYDPPKSKREASFTSARLNDLLECSILTFHTPLTLQGDYSTHHWLDEEKLSGSSFRLVVNTSRGAVLDEKALLEAMEKGTVGDIIMDVWENEPVFDDRTARQACIATPHIAGYSIQSKYRATALIVKALADHFSIELPVFSPPPEAGVHPSFDTQEIENLTLGEILCRIHPIRNYQGSLQKLIGIDKESKTKGFNKLRTSIPYRNEYPNISLPQKILNKFGILNQLISQS